MNSTLSVVIPTYQGAAFIEEALASVFGQTRRPEEIIVVDDASHDATPLIVQRIAECAPLPVRFIRLARNSGGPAHPINVGVSRAAGDLISILDQDDVFSPTSLEDQLFGFHHHPSAGLAFCLCADMSSPDMAIQSPRVLNVFLGKQNSGQSSQWVPRKTLLYELMINGNFIMGYPGFMFRRQYWVAKGGIDEHYTIVSDHDMLFWLAGHTDAIFLPKILYYRRTHGANLSSRTIPGHSEDALLRYHYLRCHPAFFHGSVSTELHSLFEHLANCLYRFGHASKALDLILRAAAVSGWDESKVRLVARFLFPPWLRSANQLLNRNGANTYLGQALTGPRHHLGVALRHLPFGSRLVDLLHGAAALH